VSLAASAYPRVALCATFDTRACLQQARFAPKKTKNEIKLGSVSGVRAHCMCLARRGRGGEGEGGGDGGERGEGEGGAGAKEKPSEREYLERLARKELQQMAKAKGLSL
jgi:hypothetical protein